MTDQHEDATGSLVRECFHTTAMVADYERTRDALARLVGLRVLEDSRIEDPAVGRRGGMTWIGDNVLEIGEPIVEGGAVDRFVRRFGSHMSSFAVYVDDIDDALAVLETKGVVAASRVDTFAFTPPAGTAGVVFEWFGGTEHLDPRYGAAMPDGAVEPLLDVTHMAFGGAVVVDPVAAAERIAELFGREVTFVDRAAGQGDPVAGVSTGDMTLALYRIPEPGESTALWGWEYTKAQTSSLGVKVPDLAAAHGALIEAGVPVVRADERAVVIHPDATGGVILVVVDRFLPGDPRSTD